MIAGILAVVAIVSLVTWILIRSTPIIVQGEVDATSYKASSKIAGRIDTMLVEQGDWVRKGQLLYVLSTPELDAKLRQAQAAQSAAEAQDRKAYAGARIQQIEAARGLLEKAEAGLELAKKDFERARNLYAQGVIPAQKFDEAQANYQAMQANVSSARAQYEMAKDGTRIEDKEAAGALVQQAASAVSEVKVYLSDAYVYSPADGQISTLIARQGELVGTGYPVVSILDMGDMWVTFNLLETYLPKIRIGTRLVGYVPALDRDVELEVYYISPQADFATWAATRTRGGFDVRTFAVKARPVTRHDGMRPGMSVLVNWDEIAA